MRKKIRFYYWLITSFLQKQIRLIILSFTISILLIIAFISVSPTVDKIISSSRHTIGYVGQFDYHNLPDEISTKISSGLVFVDGRGNLIPALAANWEGSEDSKTFRFHLKKDIYWSDGKIFTASDVNYRFQDVSSKIISPYLIQFEVKESLPIFPTYLTKPILKWPAIGVAGLYQTGKTQLKGGYLKEIELIPNKVNMPILIYRFYDNETQLLNAYKMGEVREFTTTKKNIVEMFKTWKNSDVIRNIDYGLLLTLFFNNNTPFLKDKDVRQAIAVAFDKNIFSDYGLAAESPIPPDSWAFNSDLKKQLYNRELLEKITKKDSNASDEAKLRFVSFFEYADMAEIINKNLNEAGLQTKLDLVSYSAEPKFDLLLAYLKLQKDPDQYFFWHSSQQGQGKGNITGYQNLKVDKQLEDGRRFIKTSQRNQFYLPFQKTVLDDPPAAFIYYPYVYTIRRK